MEEIVIFQLGFARKFGCCPRDEHFMEDICRSHGNLFEGAVKEILNLYGETGLALHQRCRNGINA